MIKYLKFIIILSGLLLTESLLSQEQIKSKLNKQEGIVTFVFEKDSVMKKYWFKKSILIIDSKTYYLVPSEEDIMVRLDFLCNALDSILPYEKRTVKSIFDFKQYQDTSKSEYYRHVGGDAYLVKDNLIEITFHIKAYVVIINKKPCEKFTYGRNVSCPIDYQEVFYPMAVIIDVLQAKSLTRREAKKLKIKRIKNVDIDIGICY